MSGNEVSLCGVGMNRVEKTDVDDSDNLEIGEKRMRREVVDELDRSLTSSLRDHRDRLDLDDSRIVRSDRSEQITGDGRTQVGGADERLHDVLGENERRQVVLDVVVGDVDVLESKGNVGGGDGSDPPVSLAREDLLLVLSRRDYLDLVSGDVRRSSLNGSDLIRSLGRLLNLSLAEQRMSVSTVGVVERTAYHLLSLNRRSRNLHSENDISNLRTRQRSSVDSCETDASAEDSTMDQGRRLTISLGVIAENQISKSDFDSHPFLVLERRPYVVRSGDRVLVRSQDDFRFLVVL